MAIFCPFFFLVDFSIYFVVFYFPCVRGFFDALLLRTEECEMFLCPIVLYIVKGDCL